MKHRKEPHLTPEEEARVVDLLRSGSLRARPILLSRHVVNCRTCRKRVADLYSLMEEVDKK